VFDLREAKILNAMLFTSGKTWLRRMWRPSASQLLLTALEELWHKIWYKSQTVRVLGDVLLEQDLLLEYQNTIF